MKPPSTATVAARRHRRDALARALAGRRSCRAPRAVCSASVTSTVRASTQRARHAVIGERRRDDPAADQLADRQHRVERPRRHLAQHGQRVHQRRSARRTRVARRATTAARLVARHRRRDRDVPLEQRAAAPPPRVRRRRPRPAAPSRPARRSRSTSADTTTTGARPSSAARCDLLPRTMPIDAADRVGIGDRRAAELHHDAHARL